MKNEYGQLIKNCELFLFDMDGTLYLGNTLFDFTKELLDTIKVAGKKYLYITNNSSKSVKDYVKKLASLGIDATEDEFLTSSQATAHHLKKDFAGAKLYVCGTNSLKAELESEGFIITENLDEVEVIVMGFDTELTFEKLKAVSRLLSEKDLPYFATNPDLVCPTEFGSVPDCGSVCEMIYNSTKKRPEFIGKPSPLMPILAMEKMGVSKEKTAVVGDRIYTDIKSGINAGAVSVLVLSGETDLDTLERSPDKPDVVLNSGREILDILLEK